MIVQGIWLQKVNNVEPVSSSSYCVLESEVEPLVINFGVVIWFQDEVIFELIDLNGSPQVARLKTGFKIQCVIRS